LLVVYGPQSSFNAKYRLLHSCRRSARAIRIPGIANVHPFSVLALKPGTEFSRRLPLHLTCQRDDARCEYCQASAIIHRRSPPPSRMVLRSAAATSSIAGNAE
jgi:hypothetical protein